MDYLYENSDVLVNKFGIRDRASLEQIERQISLARYSELEKSPVAGNFDFKHLCEIHRRLFQDIYEWAGTPRTVDISKGNLFCRAIFIQSAADDIFTKLELDGLLKGLSIDEFIIKLADYMADVNSLHPFREGNGRTQRIFFIQLAKEAGYDLNIENWDKGTQLEADTLAMRGKMEKLLSLLRASITECSDPKHIRKQDSILEQLEAYKKKEAKTNRGKTPKRGSRNLER